ncbi:MAG: hypothetical protein KDJ40_10680 [Hyphomicrobiales bacterium]|nr:hypothetical protein [Hyphomicrobiales bacterium]
MRNLKSTVALLALVTGFIAAVPTIALAQSAPTVTGVEGCLTSNLNVVSWGGGYGSPNISIQYLGPGFNYYTGVNSTPGTFGDETIAAGTYIYSGSVANYDNWVATTQNGVDPLMGIATGSHGYGAPLGGSWTNNYECRNPTTFATTASVNNAINNLYQDIQNKGGNTVNNYTTAVGLRPTNVSSYAPGTTQNGGTLMGQATRTAVIVGASASISNAAGGSTDVTANGLVPR